MVRDSRYVTNTAYSGAESLVISRFRCTTQERATEKTKDREKDSCGEKPCKSSFCKVSDQNFEELCR